LTGGGKALEQCHSERSEESALVRLRPELQILRFAQDDTDFQLHGWAAGPWTLRMKAMPSDARCALPKVFLVLQQKVVICHAGDVVAHHAMQGFLPALRNVEGRETAGAIEVITKEAPHAAHDDLPLRPHAPIRVKISVQELLQLPVVAGSTGA